MARAALLVAAAVLLASAATGSAHEYFADAAPRVAFDDTLGAQSGPWKKAEKAAPTDFIPLVFAVKQNTDNLEATLMKVADPASPSYGEHLTFEEVGAMFTDPERSAAVHEFLNGFDIAERTSTPHGEYIEVSVSVAVAEDILKTEFHRFLHLETGETIVRAPHYSLPDDVAANVDFVGHVTSFPVMRKKPIFHRMDAPHVAKVASGDDCHGAGVSTPQVIDCVYGIKNNTVATKTSSNALFETIQQYYEPSDLQQFDQKYNVPTQKVSKVVGKNDPSSCNQNPNNCIEAELDVQQITAIAQDTATTFWSIPGTESFLTWAQAVAADPNPPLVHSISYGSDETQVGSQQATAFDNEVMKLGLQGVTVVVASGDDGVAGADARGNPSACGFSPSYPATAPHVVSVGATQGPESGQPEIACSSKTGGGITTGGGFSTLFDQAAYQSSDVSNYLSNGPDLPPSGQFNGKGRGYPDVALMGHSYSIVVGGSAYQGSGTSASTPVFAAMLTLVNGNRMVAGKKPLGFVNPALYNLDASAFNDITSGENNCAAGAQGQQTCCQYGFTATKGWDPLTGRGSVNFPVFAKALEALP